MSNIDKDQSGAAVRALPSDLTEREEIDLLCQVERYMSITDKHSQTHPEADAEEARIYSLVNSLIAKRFSDIGAAVRGEVVAVDIDTLRKIANNLEADQFNHSAGQLRDIAERLQAAAPVSAHAADAPAEPSNEQIIALMKPELDQGDGGYICDMHAEHVIAAGRALLKSRAADALDSQPTVPYPLLRAAFATAESGPDGYFVRFKFPTLSAMQDAHMEWYGVSSQPTDVGVRK